MARYPSGSDGESVSAPSAPSRYLPSQRDLGPGGGVGGGTFGLAGGAGGLVPVLVASGEVVLGWGSFGIGNSAERRLTRGDNPLVLRWIVNHGHRGHLATLEEQVLIVG